MLNHPVLHHRPDYPRVDGTLVGPVLVLAEADVPDCMISAVYVSRYTDPALIGLLERALRGIAPIEEVAAAELTTLASGQKHDGVVAVLHGRPHSSRPNELVLHLFALRTIVVRHR